MALLIVGGLCLLIGIALVAVSLILNDGTAQALQAEQLGNVNDELSFTHFAYLLEFIVNRLTFTHIDELFTCVKNYGKTRL